MKKNKILFLAVIIMAIISIILLIFKNPKSTIDENKRDFAIKDTASITKIFMVNKSNDKVLLTREKNYWVVNNKHKARKDAIAILMKTLYNMDVKAPVSKSKHNTVIRMLSGQSTKVEVYSNDKLMKTFYVGGPTPDHLGTYMLLEGADYPFIIHIPGFNGYLSTRFFLEEHLWRSPEIFNYKFNEIASISCINGASPDKSFTVFNHGDNTYSMIDYKKNNVEKFDTMSVKHYIAFFKDVSYQALLPDFDENKKDSILNSIPYYTLIVEDIEGNKTTLKTFLMPNYEKITDNNGNLLDYDPNMLYGYINNTDFCTIQFGVFDPLFRDIDDFFSK
ncbi:MAG: hypothetical protein Kow0068_15820 [Marinilabiliales bacterium]